MKTIRLIVKDIVGPYCATYEDGVKLFRVLYPLRKTSEKVDLDFQGIQLTSSSFFNGAILHLLPEFTDNDGNLRISFCNLTPRDKFVLRHILEAPKHADEATV